MPGMPMRNLRLPDDEEVDVERLHVDRDGAERLIGVDVEQRAARMRDARRVRATSCSEAVEVVAVTRRDDRGVVVDERSRSRRVASTPSRTGTQRHARAALLLREPHVPNRRKLGLGDDDALRRCAVKSIALATALVASDTELNTAISSGRCVDERANALFARCTSVIHASQSMPLVFHDSRYRSAAARVAIGLRRLRAVVHRDHRREQRNARAMGVEIKRGSGRRGTAESLRWQQRTESERGEQCERGTCARVYRSVNPRWEVETVLSARAGKPRRARSIR